VRFKYGTPNVAEATNVTLELFDLLGLIGDLGAARESLTQKYTRLANLGHDGRLYPTLSPSQATFERLIAVAESLRPSNVDTEYRYAPLWVPTSNKEYRGYAQRELDGTDELGVSLAVFNNVTTNRDPMLFGLNLPYDTERAEEGETTQLDLIKLVTTQYGESNIRPSTHRDFLIWSIMDRIRKIPVSEQALAKGWMRIPTLGRKVLPGGGSVVGDVFSDGGQLRFAWNDGRANDDSGVGFSVGEN
jgi:hypothetical protein